MNKFRVAMISVLLGGLAGSSAGMAAAFVALQYQANPGVCECEMPPLPDETCKECEGIPSE